jgi:hypothetical protein
VEFSAQIDFPAPPDAVAEMFATTAYVYEKVAESGASDGTVEVAGTASGAFTVTTRRRMPTDDIPDAYRSLVGSGLEVRQVEAWEAPRPDGIRHGTIALEVAGVPVRVTGSLSLAPSPAGSTQRVAGTIRASLPLFGKAIEKAVVGSVDRVVEVERRVGHRWLTRG